MIVRGQVLGVPSEAPGCNWPGSARLGVFLAATMRNRSQLLIWETRLHCDEGPFLGPHPPDVATCEDNQIRIAETVPALRAIHAAQLFPNYTGSRRCAIPVGRTGRIIEGTCSVPDTVIGPRNDLFVETWKVDGRVLRHSWLVTLWNRHTPKLLSQGGAPPPQQS